MFLRFVYHLAVAAAHPALRNAQLIVHDLECGTATGAMGDITHGVCIVGGARPFKQAQCLGLLPLWGANHACCVDVAGISFLLVAPWRLHDGWPAAGDGGGCICSANNTGELPSH